MTTTKTERLTIRLTQTEKKKVQEQAQKMSIDASKFVRDYLIKLISDK